MKFRTIDTFLGKPVEYWVELDKYIEGNKYDWLVEENAKMRLELQRLYAIEIKYKFALDVMKKLKLDILE